jgi:CubicO group peptidase (beta-lactamase class C family)
LHLQKTINMKKQLLTALFITARAIGAGAQTFPATWGNRMQTVLDSVNDVNQNLVGVSAAVYMPGYGLWTGVSGISEPGVPMDKGMRMLIGSNSKLFMAATMLKLQEQHVLSLEDHISRWINHSIPTVDTSATIRQLLMHESGMGDFSRDRPDDFTAALYADTSHFFTAEELVDSAGAPVYPKGRGYHYSNDGYNLCTMIIQSATGQDYWHNLHSLILDPLQMDSTFAPLHDSYQPIANSNYYGSMFVGYGFTSFMSSFPGAGDIASTPQEMVQWYNKMFSGQVLADSSLRQLTAIEPSSLYGLGITELISPRIGGMFYLSGEVGAFTSEAMYDKDTKASIFLAINTMDGVVYTGQYLAPLLDVFTKEMPPQANDAGIIAVLSPIGITCDASVAPVVTLKNYGTDPLTSATIKLLVDGSIGATQNWTGTLAPGDTISVTLPASLLTHGMHSIKAYTTLPNGAAEGYNWNDTFSARIGANLATAYNGNFNENFEGTTTPVLVWSDNNGMEGQAGVSHLSGYNSVHSMARGCYANGDYGNVSNIDIPAVHLAAGSSPALNFRYAYSTYPGSADSLEVLISTDCGASWTSLFNKGGSDLSDEDSSYVEYYPQTAAEWKLKTIPLSSYSGDAFVRFRMFNGVGNNIFLDDINLKTPTGIAAINTPAMLIFPNPAKDQVMITGLPVNTAIRLTDITGKVLQEMVIVNGNNRVSLAGLSPGTYLLSSTFGTKKIVKL